MRWTVLLPVKALPAAKSRLVPATAGPDEHRHLVEAIRADTLSAIRAASSVARIVIVSDTPDSPAGVPDAPDTVVLVQTTPGLNGALVDAAALAGSHWPDDAVAALVGDLPALQPAELDDALAAAGDHDRAFVPDVEGTGTTMVTALPGIGLAPQFGPGSAAAHAGSSAVALEAGPGLRHDVDTDLDLARAAGLGLGPATTRLLQSATPR